jgi:beta-alanine degradation protein BauB
MTDRTSRPATFSLITRCSVTFVLAVLCASVSLILAQDPAKVGPTIYTCTFENERVRVCEVVFTPGESIGMHSHPDHLVHVLEGGKIKITKSDGTSQELEVNKGDNLWIKAETHSGANVGKTTVKLLVVELKQGGK